MPFMDWWSKKEKNKNTKNIRKGTQLSHTFIELLPFDGAKNQLQEKTNKKLFEVNQEFDHKEGDVNKLLPACPKDSI